MAMTENSRKVFEFLKAAGAGVEFTTKQVQEALGFEKPGSVTGSVQGLVKKGLAERHNKEIEVMAEDGSKKLKTVSVFALNDKGMNFDPDAPIEK